MTNDVLHRMRKALAVMAGILSLASCSMMQEEMEPCGSVTQALRVYLKYDYNTAQADLLSDHVGEVRLYVIDDATSTVVKDTIVSNRDHALAIKHHPQSQMFYIDVTGLPVNRKYRFAATALQRPYDETLLNPHHHFRITSPTVGEDIKQLSARLMHATEPDIDGRCAVEEATFGLDTLWMGHTTKPLDYRAVEAEPTTAAQFFFVADTISMVRDTKFISLSIQNLDEDKKRETRAEDFDVEIVVANSDLQWNNELAANQALLVHRPFAASTSTKWGKENADDDDSQDVVVEQTAHYELATSRLIYYQGADSHKNARLRITRKSDGMRVADFNLPMTFYDDAHMAHRTKWGAQEFLDRCYEYNLSLFLRGDTWEGLNIEVTVNVTAWRIHIQNEKLGSK
ncbi:MAG: FimB/Mfa2 family fimbrial subunit [Bacteroidales bacterium]|nr:FimB/Mfa2 family fimbrial subunit [Candidatus Physcousia equi]